MSKELALIQLDAILRIVDKHRYTVEGIYNWGAPLREIRAEIEKRQVELSKLSDGDQKVVDEDQK